MINSFLMVLSVMEKDLTGFFFFFFFPRFNTGYYTTLSVAEDKAEIKRTMVYSVNLCLLKSQVIPQAVSSGNNC